MFKLSNQFLKVCFQNKRTHSIASFSMKSFNTHDFHGSNIFLASASVIGITIYVAQRNKIACDVEPIIENNVCTNEQHNLQEAIRRSRDIVQQIKDQHGIPGLVVGVSINGKNIWKEGFGFADIENRVLCTPDTVMRIASISKSITMAAVAKLWEQGKLDIDKPVQEYVPSFPLKRFNGKSVTVTCRQLVSHLGGIRHYHNKLSKTDEKGNAIANDEMQKEEYYLKIKHTNVQSALDIFKDDPLIDNPGNQFYYSTHGWTLVSAIVEASAKETFTTHIKKLFKSLGMKSTYLDENDILIYNRSRNYTHDKKGTLINSPYVDNSYKWAGGGFLSTVGDLLQFANAMLYSFQYQSNTLHSENQNKAAVNRQSDNENFENRNQLPSFLDSKTVKAMWQQIATTYGMGWFVKAAKQECQFCENNDLTVFHTGGAVGASSILLILPKESKDEHSLIETLPKGVIVTVICNMQSVHLYPTALKISKEFDNLLL